jgi:hypothetical protein
MPTGFQFAIEISAFALFLMWDTSPPRLAPAYRLQPDMLVFMPMVGWASICPW